MTAIPSPNIWNDPDAYETENEGVDPDGTIEAAMRSVTDWAGRAVLDVGCGTGYHLPRFAARAAHVVGVEPHPPLVARAAARVRRRAVERSLAPMAVLRAGAQALPLAGGSVDVVHARWAYFFGPGSEPGLAELDRVVAPGGAAFVIDNDTSRSTFGGWFRRAYPTYDGAAVRRFWLRRGWAPIDVTIRWEFATREDFARVLGIEFPGDVVDAVLAEHPRARGTDYGVTVWWRRF